MTLARARSTLVLLAAAETQARVKRLQQRAAPLIIYKTNPNAMIVRSRPKYHPHRKHTPWALMLPKEPPAFISKFGSHPKAANAGQDQEINKLTDTVGAPLIVTSVRDAVPPPHT
jgi:hypothetical protein